MRTVYSLLAAAVVAFSLSACALTGGPARPHDHGRDKTGAPTPVLNAEQRQRQRCEVMVAEMEQGPRHDHSRERTGAGSVPARPHNPDDPTHEQCRAILGNVSPR